MKKKQKAINLLLLLLIAGGCQKGPVQAPPSSPETIAFTDMAGREIQVPTEINKVYCTGPVGLIILYTIDPGLLTGLNYKLSPGEKRFLEEEFSNLPILGGWYGKGNEGNLEEISRARPDLIINAGIITEESIALADKVQKQTGIPAIVVEADFPTMATMYDFLGTLLKRKERTDLLKAYVTEVLEEAETIRESIKEKVSVYYAEGRDGLQTDPKGSMHSEILELIGAENAAAVPLKSGGYGRQTISIEQLLNWNPEVILVTNNCIINPEEESAWSLIKREPLYSTIEAVKKDRVYEIPGFPFNWFDRPPSVNRLIGIRWAANMIYPDLYNHDMKAEARRFFKLFYRYDLQDEEIEELLSHSGNGKGAAR